MISGRLIRSRSLRPDSAKTYENLVCGTACRKTVEFPGPASAALIGRLKAVPEKGMSFCEPAARGVCQVRFLANAEANSYIASRGTHKGWGETSSLSTAHMILGTR
jgi:hypothetical protein